MSDQAALLAAHRPFADATFAFTSEGNILAFDAGFQERMGWKSEEWLGRPLARLAHPDDGDALRAAAARVAAGQAPPLFEVRWLRRDGGYVTTQCSLAPVVRETRVAGGVGALRDVTARKSSEERAADILRTEVVGRLASGVGHYFNNLMTTVLGFSELLLDALPRDHGQRPGVEEIYKAGHQAAAITTQLLALARKQPTRPMALDLNVVVAETGTLFHTLFGNLTHLTTSLGPAPQWVRADGDQLKQILTHLLLHARDALPVGGRLLLATAPVHVDEATARARPDVAPGPYAFALVERTDPDTGEGLVHRPIETFFLSEQARSDLDAELAAARIVLKRNGGHLAVTTRAGGSPTFALLLPTIPEADPTSDRR